MEMIEQKGLGLDDDEIEEEEDDEVSICLLLRTRLPNQK